MAATMKGVSRIVDAHHHLWDLGAKHRYPWLMKQSVVRFFGDPAPIQRNYGVTEFRDDIGALPIVASVHIQVGVDSGDELAETLWLQDQHRRHGLPSAIVAFCDLTADRLPARLDDHCAANALRGIRQIVGRSAEEDRDSGSDALLDNPAFLEGLIHLAQRGLSFDLQLIPRQMERAAKLLRKVPNLQVALCHGGSLSDFSPEGRARWKRGISRLAKLPNVICKLSGFGMFDKRWSADSIREQFYTALDAFGPSRIAFGSNFPVDKLAMGYGQVWRRYFQLTAGLSSSERQQMFHDTAADFYNLPRQAEPARMILNS
jgi:predicted TIM-barrel fold metal-dependent hydrolase